MTVCSSLGKQVIHPDQIQIVQKAFSPSDEQVEWAEGLIEEFQKQQLLGKVRMCVLLLYHVVIVIYII